MTCCSLYTQKIWTKGVDDTVLIHNVLLLINRGIQLPILEDKTVSEASLVPTLIKKEVLDEIYYNWNRITLPASERVVDSCLSHRLSLPTMRDQILSRPLRNDL
mmetsp:Transcript_2117/g.3041  ORF Transcript_2117/g.3041 Transcript_2117/m.3041 type:complete len:104 (-) Transcript_2117:70-381(-)